MAPLKAEIVSVSSEDSKNKAENLLNPTNLKNWLCNKSDREKDLLIELKLEISSRIEHINIGNHGSAFVEILVGRSSWQEGRPYEVLLPSISLMTPADCKKWINTSRVFLLGKASFRGHIAEQKWNLVRIRCHQPFTKEKQFGLGFLELRSNDEEVQKQSSFGNTSPNNSSKNVKLAVQKAIRSSGMSDMSKGVISRTERCVEKALTPVKNGRWHYRKAWSDSALKKTKMGVSKKFQLEVECFLKEAKLEQMDFEDVKVSELRKNMEKIRGFSLSKDEKRVFFEVIGRKVNESIQHSPLTFNQVRGHKSCEPSSPPNSFQINDSGKYSQLTTPLSGLTDEDKTRLMNKRMQRRSLNITRNALFYDNDVTGLPPSKISKDDVESDSAKTRNGETAGEDAKLQKRGCPLCGKVMSQLALQIHAQYCEGKTEFDDDSQDVEGDCGSLEMTNNTKNIVKDARNGILGSSTAANGISDSFSRGEDVYVQPSSLKGGYSCRSIMSCSTVDTTTPKTSFPDFINGIAHCRSSNDRISPKRQTQNLHSTTTTDRSNSDCMITFKCSGLSNADTRPLFPVEPRIDEAECPVCLRHFPTSYIEYHANQCIDFGC